MNGNKKNIILVGGGGFSLEIYSYLLDEIHQNTLADIEIKGVLDSIPDCELCMHHPEIKYLGDISLYQVEKGDYALIASGNSIQRRKIAAEVKNLNFPLHTYIHSTAYISPSASLGKGVFVGPHGIVSAHSIIEDNVALNVFCGVGHGAKIGPHSVMSPYSVINGDCELGEAVFLGSRVTLNPKICVGSFSLIDAGCILREPIDEFSLVSQRVTQKVFDNKILRSKILP